MRVDLAAAAVEEIREATAWYVNQREGLGAAFAADVAAALRRIRDAPLSFEMLDNDVRQARLHRFRYGVIYRVERNRV